MSVVGVRSVPPKKLLKNFRLNPLVVAMLDEMVSDSDPAKPETATDLVEEAVRLLYERRTRRKKPRENPKEGA